MRHERRRDSGDDRSVGERDAGELQPGESDDTGIGIVRSDVNERVPGGVLRRSGDDNGDDDVLSGDNNVFGPFTRTVSAR